MHRSTFRRAALSPGSRALERLSVVGHGMAPVLVGGAATSRRPNRPRNRNRPGRHSAGAVLRRPYLIRCRVGGVVSTGPNGSFTVGL